MRSILFILVSVFTISSVNAQKFSQEKFLEEMKTFMVKDGDSTTQNAYNGIQSVWGSRLKTKQKETLVDIANKMYTRKLRPAPEFVQLGVMINGAVNNQNFSEFDLDTLLYATSKILDKGGYNVTQIKDYLNIVSGLMNDGTVFSNRYNTLHAKGKFRIRFMEEVFEETPEYEEEEEVIEETTEEVIEEDHFDDWGDDWGDDWSDDGWGTVHDDPDPKEEKTTDDVAMEEEGFTEAMLDIGYTPPTQPERSKAIIEFEEVDFTFKTAHDTAMLKGTKGFILLETATFVGEGGSFDWTPAGLPSEVHGTFKEFNFKVKSPQLDAEGVTLHYPSKLQEPVEGVFSFRSKKRGVGKDAVYPRFMSYKSNVVIKDLGKDIIYKGGFSLNGKKVFSSSVSEGLATLEVFYEGNKKFKARARNFKLGDSLITAEPVTVSVYVRNDSIYHMGLRLKYDKKQQTVKLRKNKTKFKHAPFIDTYHNMEIYADAILWKLDDTLMHITNVSAKNHVPARFESKEYFRKIRYTQIKGLFRFHPLQLITYYSQKNRTRKIYFNDLYEKNKKNPNISKKSLMAGMNTLMEQGFIDYNPRTGYIYLKDKAVHYVKSARSKKDFDNISIVSISPGGHNSSYNLKTNEIIVRGVDEVHLSDSLSVYFRPRDRIVRISENRDFSFDGIIYTANYIFNGHDFKFYYDPFYVDLQNIDSIRFQIDVKDTVTGRTKENKTLNNKLVYTAGILYIDKPDNKSSRKRNPQYPYFDADKGAYVYFDKEEVLNNAYDKRVYFFIPPFDQDSLSSNNENAVGFNGSFTSGGIFPEFEEKLVVRPDFSFGFVHPTPEGGFQLYGGNGKFFGTVTLDKKGLRGQGRIEFLNSTITSNDFVFFPDSVLARSASVVTRKGTCPLLPEEITFPEMHLQDAKMSWYPVKDSLYLQNKKNPFTFYEETATLDGKATITNKGMYGAGILKTRGAQTVSQLYKFEESQYEGREALFTILTENATKPAMKSDNVHIEFDLDSGFAYFSPEQEGYASNEFPYLRYKSSLDDGVWDLNEGVVHMKKPKEADIESSFFYSTHPRQDSLVFSAERADYFIKDQTLLCSGVPEIKVADAFILPDSNKVVIHENAKMETLENCELLIDTTYEYHHLFEGNITIQGRKSFKGRAMLEYVNFGQDTFAVEFKSFLLEKRQIGKKEDDVELHTMANGVIHDADSFMIAPEIQYRGKVTMRADKRILELDGMVKLELEGAIKMRHWLPYKNLEGNPELEVIVDNPLSRRKIPLYAGMQLKHSGGLYHTFLDTKKAPNDRSVFDAKGFMKEDYETGSFKVSSIEKIKGEVFEGNMMAYDEKDELFKYEGKFDFVSLPEEHKKHFGLTVTGLSTHSILDTVTYINALVGMSVDLPGSAIFNLGQGLLDYADANGGEKVVEEMTPELKVKMANVIGDKKTLMYADLLALDYTSLLSQGGELAKGIVISDVKMKWSRQYNAWYNVGPIGISSVGKTDINTYFQGYMEVRQTLKGDMVTLYILGDDQNWYYLSYSANALFATSSDGAFNKIIGSKSTMEKSILKGLYYFAPATAFEKQKFINNFKVQYLGEEGSRVIDNTSDKNVPDDEFDGDGDDDDSSFDEDSDDDSFDEGDSDDKEDKPKKDKKKNKDEGDKDDSSDDEDFDEDSEDDDSGDDF